MMRVPEWQGPLAWADEMRRQCRIMTPRTELYQRFRATAQQLTLWRVRSPVQMNRAGLDAVLPLLENAWRNHGRLTGFGLLDPQTGWSQAELGALLVEARNRASLFALGRDRPRIKGPRLDPAQIPLPALEQLIQRHPSLDLVERLRAERNRRLLETA